MKTTRIIIPLLSFILFASYSFGQKITYTELKGTWWVNDPAYIAYWEFKSDSDMVMHFKKDTTEVLQMTLKYKIDNSYLVTKIEIRGMVNGTMKTLRGLMKIENDTLKFQSGIFTDDRKNNDILEAPNVWNENADNKTMGILTRTKRKTIKD
jgi:hypothetical protein